VFDKVAGVADGSAGDGLSIAARFESPATARNLASPGCNGSCTIARVRRVRDRVSCVSGKVRCSWCGVPLDADAGYRATEPAGERIAAFCRLEHVVPWTIQGPHWDPGTLAEPVRDDPQLGHCAHCGAQLGDTRVLLVRHRGEHRIADAFCSTDHLRAWALSGGRWR
jgi:hypothetical protein